MENPILANENYAFGLDAQPMVLALVLLNIVHPGVVLRGENSEFPRLSRREKKQLKQAKKAAKEAEKMKKKRRNSAKFVEEGQTVSMEERPLAASAYDTDERADARREQV